MKSVFCLAVALAALTGFASAQTLPSIRGETQAATQPVLKPAASRASESSSGGAPETTAPALLPPTATTTPVATTTLATAAATSAAFTPAAGSEAASIAATDSEPAPALIDAAADASSFTTTTAARATVAPPPPPRAVANFGDYSFAAAANVVDQVCGYAGDATIGAAAVRLNLVAAESTGSVSWALPADMKAWEIDTLDSDVFLYSYGADQKACGAVIARPLAGIVVQRLKDEMLRPARGFVVDSEQVLDRQVKFVRFRSPKGRFVDLLEYPPEGDQPGLVKLEMLPPT